VEEDFAEETRILAVVAAAVAAVVVVVVVVVVVAVVAQCFDSALNFPSVHHRRHTPLEISLFSMDSFF